MTVINTGELHQLAPYGILSRASTVLDKGDGHWINGFDTNSLVNSGSTSLTAVCDNSITVDDVFVSSTPKGTSYIPFDIRTEYSCSTMGTHPEELIKGATKHAESLTQFSIEQELWSGNLTRQIDGGSQTPEHLKGKNRWLASSDAVDITPSPGTGVRVKLALALLEDAISKCLPSQVATIHMTPLVASVLKLREESGVLKTRLGNTVIVGSGYTGEGPGNSAVSGLNTYIYATGPVTVLLGDIKVDAQMTQTVDTSNNKTTVYADRPASVFWESNCHFAALVDLSLDFD